MIVGGIEEIRTDDAANEIFVADNAFGDRVMVFSTTSVMLTAKGRETALMLPIV